MSESSRIKRDENGQYVTYNVWGPSFDSVTQTDGSVARVLRSERDLLYRLADKDVASAIVSAFNLVGCGAHFTEARSFDRPHVDTAASASATPYGVADRAIDHPFA